MKDLFSFDFLKCLIESASDKNIPVRIQNDFNHIVKILKTFGEPHESIKNERKVENVGGHPFLFRMLKSS